MSHPTSPDDALAEMSREEMMSALFAHLIVQNTNMALMFLGKVPHPQSGETIQDFEAAKMFIDQLEMLEAKTHGNLSRDEDQLLKESLTHLRMTFVQAIDTPLPPAPLESTDKVPASAAPVAPSPAAEESESRKRFSKKF